LLLARLDWQLALLARATNLSPAPLPAHRAELPELMIVLSPSKSGRAITSGGWLLSTTLDRLDPLLPSHPTEVRMSREVETLIELRKSLAFLSDPSNNEQLLAMALAIAENQQKISPDLMKEIRLLISRGGVDGEAKSKLRTMVQKHFGGSRTHN
jgi:hypothetical protein